MSEEMRYRYPGANFFKYEDRDIFCGREKEIDLLFTQVMINNTLVLHAESGIGKSSIIQAGLIPEIEEEQPGKYIIVTLRLQNFNNLALVKDEVNSLNDYYLINQTILTINKKVLCEDIDIPYLDDKTSKKDLKDDQSLHSLWIIAKKLAKLKKKLIIIFDQFEEIQSYPPRYIEHLKISLSGLVGNDIPYVLNEEIKKKTSSLFSSEPIAGDDRQAYNENLKFLEDKLDVKLIFVVREDKLGVMSLFSDYFPDILKNDFVLQPLTIEGAKKAIIEPALKEGNFYSHQFIFKSGLVEKIIDALKDNMKQVIETFQLQLVCKHAEDIIKDSSSIDIITDDLIGDIKEIFQKFYDKLIYGLDNIVASNEEKSNLLELLEERFIYIPEQRRVPVLKARILEIITPKTLKYLEDSRLIRSIAYQETFNYELSHDTLIGPILKNYRERIETLNKLKLLAAQRQARQRKYVILIIFTLLIISVASAIFGFKRYYNEKKALVELEKSKIKIEEEKAKAEKNYLDLLATDKKRKESEVNHLIKTAKYFESLQYYSDAEKNIKRALEIDSTNKEAIILLEKYQKLK